MELDVGAEDGRVVLYVSLPVRRYVTTRRRLWVAPCGPCSKEYPPPYSSMSISRPLPRFARTTDVTLRGNVSCSCSCVCVAVCVRNSNWCIMPQSPIVTTEVRPAETVNLFWTNEGAVERDDSDDSDDIRITMAENRDSLVYGSEAMFNPYEGPQVLTYEADVTISNCAVHVRDRAYDYLIDTLLVTVALDSTGESHTTTHEVLRGRRLAGQENLTVHISGNLEVGESPRTGGLVVTATLLGRASPQCRNSHPISGSAIAQYGPCTATPDIDSICVTYTGDLEGSLELNESNSMEYIEDVYSLEMDEVPDEPHELEWTIMSTPGTCDMPNGLPPVSTTEGVNVNPVTIEVAYDDGTSTLTLTYSDWELNPTTLMYKKSFTVTFLDAGEAPILPLRELDIDCGESGVSLVGVPDGTVTIQIAPVPVVVNVSTYGCPSPSPSP